MYTLGYAFRPWRDPKAIADGPSILSYVRDVAREAGIDRHIRFRHRVVKASWSSEQALWSVEVAVGPEGERRTLTCRFVRRSRIRPGGRGSLWQKIKSLKISIRGKTFGKSQ